MKIVYLLSEYGSRNVTRKVHIFTLEAKVFVKRDGKPYPEEASRMPSL